MSNSNWESKFEKMFEAGVLACKAGEQQPDKLVTTRDQAFLGTIGCTAQEFFDFADDFCEYGAPDFATALAVTTIRRRYFLDVQHGIPSQFQVDPHELPPKNEALDGFRWLPRIIAKARAKLRGELDPSIMYGCGGDREFLESIGMTMPQFLQMVWDAGQDDERIVEAVKGSLAAVR